LNGNVVFSCKYHVVFCPEYRRPVLVEGVDRRLKRIIAEAVEETDSLLIEAEVMPDHVHLLIHVDPQFGVHRVVKAIKGRSSRLLRSELRWLRSRLPTLSTNSYFVDSGRSAARSYQALHCEPEERRSAHEVRDDIEPQYGSSM
jgi:putative transposase